MSVLAGVNFAPTSTTACLGVDFRAGTRIESLKALTIREWPGNIRELENLIERSVTLSKGLVLEVPPGELLGPADQRDPSLDSK